MGALAGATAAAAYSEGGVGPDHAAAATDAADQIRDQLAAQPRRIERLRWALGLKTVKDGPHPNIHAVETLVPGS